MHVRNLLLLALGVMTLALSLPVVYPPFSPFGASDDAVVNAPARKRGPKEAPQWLKWYQIQRTYGNPDVDIAGQLHAAYAAFSSSSQFSLSKLNKTQSNVWSSAGPVNIAGRIRALAMHPSDPNVIYAGAASGGVWKSTDFGVTWNPTSDFMQTLAIGALAIDPNNPNRIFAGTGEPVVFAGIGAPQYYGAGVMRSDDAGATWRMLPWPSSSSGIHRIAIHPVSADTMLVASIGDLWKTTDAGQTWRRVQSGVCTDVMYQIGQPSRVFMALGDDAGRSNNGVYVSDAGGDRFSFRRVDQNFPAGDSIGRVVLAVAEQTPNRIFAALAMSNARRRTFEEDFNVVMVSSDGGATWQRRTGALAPTFTRGQAFFDLSLGVMPNNPDFVMIGGIDWYRTTNGGNSFSINTDWSLRTTNPNSARYVHADQHAILFRPGTPTTIAVGSDGGVHITTNSGLQWQMRTESMVTTQFYSVAYNPSNPAVLYGGTQDQSNMRMNGPGSRSWSFVGGGDGGSIAVDPVNSSILYITINTEQYRTQNGGGTITKITNGFEANERFGWQPPLFLHPTDRNTLYTGGHRMYKLSNAPTASSPVWSVISPDLTKANNGITSRISDAAVSPTNPDWMYTVSGDGRAMVCQNIRSLDPVWTDITTGLPNRYLADVSVDWQDHQTAYIGVSGFNSGHVYKTTNGGQSWANISGDLPDIPVNAVVRSRTDANTVFAATDYGVWVTRNGGTNWVQFGSGLPNVVVWDIDITPDNTLIAATHGRGMWTVSSLLSAEGNPGSTVVPTGFTLLQNYPNPFNPSTTITWSIARRSNVKLDIYTQRGVRVRTVLNGSKDAGTWREQVDMRDMPAGVYLYTLEVDGVRQTRKMTLLK